MAAMAMPKGGLFGRKKRTDDLAQMPVGQGPQEAPMPEKPGRDWAGILSAAGGLIAGDGGAGVARYHQLRQHRAMAEQQAMQQQQQAAMQRQNAWQDWVRKEEYKRENPMPVNNDTVADYEFIKGQLGDDAAQEFLKNKANPPQYRQGPDGRFYRIDTGGAAPPKAPVGKLTPIGGPSQPAAGSFR